MIPKAICLMLSFIALLSFHESVFPTIIRQWIWSTVGVFPLGFCPGGFCSLNTGSGRQHRQVRDFDANFSKLKMSFQPLIWDPGDSNYRSANNRLLLWKDHINGSYIMFVLGIDISLFPLTKVPTNSCNYLLFFSSIGCFGFSEALLGFKTRSTHLRLDDELIFHKGLCFVADWMITINRRPPNIQDEVVKIIILQILNWRNLNGYFIRCHIIRVIGEEVQVFHDYICVSVRVKRNILLLRMWWRAIVFSLILRTHLGKTLPWIPLLIKEYIQTMVFTMKSTVNDRALCIIGWDYIGVKPYYLMQAWTPIRTNWYRNVRISKLIPGAMGFFNVMWSLKQRMPIRHTHHIRVRWLLKKENNMFNNMLASKAYQIKHRQIRFFVYVIFSRWHIFYLCNNLFSEVLYWLNTLVILID